MNEVVTLQVIVKVLMLLTILIDYSGKEYDRVIILRSADALKKCCRRLLTDRPADVADLTATVSRLFAVTEAEGKVRLRPKSANSPRNAQSPANHELNGNAKGHRSSKQKSSDRTADRPENPGTRRQLPDFGKVDSGRRVLPQPPDEQGAAAQKPLNIRKLAAMFENSKA